MELPFSLRLGDAGGSFVLHGQIDLLAVEDGVPWVVDYKYAHRGAARRERYRFQLQLYALAAARLLGTEGEVRTSLVFLRDRSSAITELVDGRARGAIAAQVIGLGRDLETMEGGEGRPPLPVGECHALGCGFAGRCHPGGGPWIGGGPWVGDDFGLGSPT